MADSDRGVDEIDPVWLELLVVDAHERINDVEQQSLRAEDEIAQRLDRLVEDLAELKSLLR